MRSRPCTSFQPSRIYSPVTARATSYERGRMTPRTYWIDSGVADMAFVNQPVLQVDGTSTATCYFNFCTIFSLSHAIPRFVQRPRFVDSWGRIHVRYLLKLGIFLRDLAMNSRWARN